MTKLERWKDCKCPIWGAPAKQNPLVLGDKKEYYSARAGGRYLINGTAAALDKMGTQAALSKLIFESNFRGHFPEVSSDEVSNARTKIRLSVVEKYDRFMALTAKLFPELGKSYSERDLWSGENSWLMQAALGSEIAMDGAEREQIQFLTKEAVQQGHLNLGRAGSNASFSISYSGHKYAASLGASLSQSDKIFVAMWFGSEEQTRLYENAIAPAVQQAGYTPIRIDNTEHNEKIDDQIIAEIRQSKAVIVDLTCGLAKPESWSKSDIVGSPRGGVFYEAGFAKGLGLPVIWSVKAEIADLENVVHFDIRQFNQLRWGEDLGEFLEKLRYRIEATLGRGPN